MVADLPKMGFSMSYHRRLTQPPYYICTAVRGAATMMVSSSNLKEFSSNGTCCEDQPVQSPLEGLTGHKSPGV